MRYSAAAILMQKGRDTRIQHRCVGFVSRMAAILLFAPGVIAAWAADSGIDHPVDSNSSRDSSVLCHLFGEPLLQQNAVTVCQQTRELPLPQRFDALSRWVLPGHGHGFRLRGAFRRSSTSLGQHETGVDSLVDLNACPESAWLLSPARELVQAASLLGQLADLQRQTEFFKPTSPEQAADQSTLLCMIEIELGDVAAVAGRLEDRFGWQRGSHNAASATERWPDLLMLWSAAANPLTSHLVKEELFGVYADLSGYSSELELDVINDYLRLLKGRCAEAELLAEQNQPPLAIASAKSLYDVFSRSDAASHAAARPLTRFHIGADGAWKISGHEIDCLAYRGPLAGDFEVNAEVSTRPGAFTELMVQGTAVIPIHGGTHVGVAAMSKGNREIALDAKLEEIESVSHLRAVVGGGGSADHFFNGRRVFQTDEKHSLTPWVVLRSWRGTVSEIRNLHLTGEPQVPQSIDLLADPSLSGWASYYDPELGDGLGEWETNIGNEQSIELISKPASGVRHSYHEDLIQYVRPLCWDANIAYEFQYHPEGIGVHPVLGRTVFLITPNGVRLHELTDGRFDKSQLRPDNVSELATQSSPSSLETEPKLGWNSAEMQIRDRRVTLTLNGQQVGQWELPTPESRKFGMFRYRDQTRAVVRNLRLTGDWPTALPALKNQPLASDEVNRMDQEATVLPSQLVHYFRDGIPANLFDFEGDPSFVTELIDGVQMVHSSEAGVRTMNVCGIIEGDFDVIADYKDLKISAGKPTWHCGIGIAVRLENPTFDRCAINRRRDRMHGHQYLGFGHKETNAGGQVVWTGGANVVDESTSGRLRILRRGNTVYGLHAEGDSPVFRIVSSTTIPPGKIGAQGLQLITDVGKGLDMSVNWTKLEIRADKIDLMTVPDQAKTLSMLNSHRKTKAVETVDFTKQSLADAGFLQVSATIGDVVSDARGATVSVQGDEFLKRYGLLKKVLLEPDFDVEVDFRIMKLDRGYPEEASSEIALQIGLESAQTMELDSDELHINEATIILRHRSDGKFMLRPRIVARSPGGVTVYRVMHSIPVKMPDKYRIVQHDRVLYFMYSEEDSAETKIIASYPVKHGLKATSVHLWVNAGREQRMAAASWERLRIHGTPAPLRSIFNYLQFPPTQP
ncbi:DUF1583 domain-containing protein [Novipirellula sp. SH528]|uniref:DUF1583 domain-containing protein n=1 Tax=Novipirellula sp. SH528 TaxID=3454466 RepID=UPI003FA0C0AC